MSANQQRRLVQEYEDNVVYLIQTPRAGCLPNLSPFALKLETWLRMADIPYQNVDNQFKYKSMDGHCPFVELDGRQIVDSNIIINELTAHFGIRMDEIALTETTYALSQSPNVSSSANSMTAEKLSRKKLADFFSYRSLIEDTLRWKCNYYCALNNRFFGTNEGVGAHFTGFKKFFFQRFYLALLKKKTMSACRAQGIGALPPDKVDSFARRELKAVSIFLDDKRYFLGDYYSTLDAIAFAHLAMLYFTPLHSTMRAYLDADCANLVVFLHRMRAKFWPDWAEATGKLSLMSRRHVTESRDTPDPDEVMPEPNHLTFAAPEGQEERLTSSL